MKFELGTCRQLFADTSFLAELCRVFVVWLLYRTLIRRVSLVGIVVERQRKDSSPRSRRRKLETSRSLRTGEAKLNETKGGGKRNHVLGRFFEGKEKEQYIRLDRLATCSITLLIKTQDQIKPFRTTEFKQMWNFLSELDLCNQRREINNLIEEGKLQPNGTRYRIGAVI